MGRAAHAELLRCVSEITTIEDAGGRAIFTRNAEGRPAYMAQGPITDDLGNAICMDRASTGSLTPIDVRHAGVSISRMRADALRSVIRQLCVTILKERFNTHRANQRARDIESIYRGAPGGGGSVGRPSSRPGASPPGMSGKSQPSISTLIAGFSLGFVAAIVLARVLL